MPIYEVRVTRYAAEEYVDITVRAKTEKAATEKALKEAKVNACLWFPMEIDAEYDAVCSDQLDFTPDCEVIE